MQNVQCSDTQIRVWILCSLPFASIRLTQKTFWRKFSGSFAFLPLMPKLLLLQAIFQYASFTHVDCVHSTHIQCVRPFISVYTVHVNVSLVHILQLSRSPVLRSPFLVIHSSLLLSNQITRVFYVRSAYQ